MSVLSVNNRCFSRGMALIFCLLCLGLTTRLEAQRHPESLGALPYYNEEPGVLKDPDWKQRPPFIRGPLDRYERGQSRLFLLAEDASNYTNYADEKYILYFRELSPWAVTGGRPMGSRNVRWDRLGSYMGGGYQRVFSLEESRSGTDHSGFSYIDHKAMTLRIGHYTYKDLHWTATVGAQSTAYIRTLFTPLTLSNSLMNAARMDLNYKERDRGTVFYSRGGESGTAVLFSNWVAGAGDDTYQESPVLMFGGHWQHAVGDYASFGGTLVNQILAFPASPHSSTLRGDLPYEMTGPKSIRVFIADDSPQETQTNGKVYDVDVLIEGERDGEKVHFSSIAGDPDYDARLEPLAPVGGAPLLGGGREAVGKETVVYEFLIPDDLTVRSARFIADVEGDYHIGVRQKHDFMSINRQGNIAPQEMQWPASFVGTEAGTRRPHKWYIDLAEEEPYYTVVRSEGNGDSRRLVSFDYGMPTGQSLASVDWNAQLIGLDFSGEVAHNLQNYMYPVGDNQGERSTERAWAYWFNVLKDAPGGLQLGGELYRMEPDYSGGYDSYRGGMSFHVDRQSSPGGRVESLTQEFSVVEDNDDHDQHPDDHSFEAAVSGELYPGWPNAMVYPGLDENVDNIADVDRNENFKLDWDEAFLTYDAEPPEFVYGIDFNNNGVPDFRENDDRPDYPYPRDNRGVHFFLRFTRLGKLGKSIAIGNYVNRELVGGGKAEATYLRYSYDIDKKGVGQLQINYDVKRVKDDIEDHTYIYRMPPDDANLIPWYNRPDTPPDKDGLRRPATPDPLLMRDSWVNTAFISSKYSGFHNVNMSNSLRWFRNSQAEIELDDGSGLLQPEAVRSQFALVNKIDYTWTRGALSLMPKFKHRLMYEKLDSEEDARVSFSDFIPIVMAEYRLTTSTRFQAGAQGLPGLPFKHWDRTEGSVVDYQPDYPWDRPDNVGTYTQTDYVAMMRITAEYFGIRDTSLFLGYQRTRRTYSRLTDRNLKQGVLFVEVISPF